MFIPLYLFCFILYMIVYFACFYLILYITYSYCYVNVFLLLYTFRSRYCVSLCRSVYCLCVNMYLPLPPGVNPVAVNKYIITYHLHYLDARRLGCSKLHTEYSHTFPATVQNLVSWTTCPREIEHPSPRFSPIPSARCAQPCSVHSVPHNNVLIGELEGFSVQFFNYWHLYMSN